MPALTAFSARAGCLLYCVLCMVTGGDLWNRVKGALVGAAVGCVGTTISGFIAAGPFGAVAGAISGAAGGAIVGGMSGYEEMVVRTAAIID